MSHAFIIFVFFFINGKTKEIAFIIIPVSCWVQTCIATTSKVNQYIFFLFSFQKINNINHCHMKKLSKNIQLELKKKYCINVSNS